MSKNHALRDQILESLRCQFAAKVLHVTLHGPISMIKYASPEQLDKFLLDLANNLAQGLIIEDDAKERS